MSKRKSIEFPGFSHANPIPGASRIGNIVMSSVISGRDPATDEMPPELDAQIGNIFAHIKSAVETAGGSPDDIIKITFFVRDPASGRAALNGEWEKMFPDPDSRPARHTQALGGSGASQVTCDFVAVLA
jgi:2-iminobutanoate/2-iminopropanoate deaminase